MPLNFAAASILIALQQPLGLSERCVRGRQISVDSAIRAWDSDDISSQHAKQSRRNELPERLMLWMVSRALTCQAAGDSDLNSIFQYDRRNIRCSAERRESLPKPSGPARQSPVASLTCRTLAPLIA